MRVLLVTPGIPFPPIWGFNIRVFQILRNLAARNRVSLLCYGGAHSDEEAAAKRAIADICDEIITVPHRPIRRSQRRRLQARTVFGPRSFHMHRLFSHQMQTTIWNLLRDRPYDLVEVESSAMASFAFGQVPVVVDEHNIEYELLDRSRRVNSSLPRSAFMAIESKKAKKEEIEVWRRVQGCVLTSQREQAVVNGTVNSLPTAVVPNGVDLDYFRPVRCDPPEPRLVFTGLMTYRPNVDALSYFIRDIFPRVRSGRPDATLTAVGWGFSEELAPLLGKGVSHTGRVEDVRPYLAGASVVVAPLRIGGGTRLKILEALAMGKAVVSTTVGCEGIDVRDGKHLVIADDPVAFARSVVQLLDDPDRAAGLGRAGRALVESRYGWSQSVAELERFHASVVESANGAARSMAGAANR